jgi:hypothetical protein
MNQPFIPNKQKKAKALAAAEKKVQEAIQALRTAAGNADNWTEFGTINYFAESLHEVLTSDNNQAGLIPFIASR